MTTDTRTSTGKSDPILNCVFSFQCPQTWEALEQTEDGNRRFCQECQKDVHYVDSMQDLHKAQVAGHCVAANIHRSESYPPVLGMPKPKKEEVFRLYTEFTNQLRLARFTEAFELLQNRPLSYTLFAEAEWAIWSVFWALEKIYNRNIGAVLQADQLHFQQLDLLATVMTECGQYESAIVLTKWKQSGASEQHRALRLANIAVRMAEAGETTKASSLMIESSLIAHNDTEVAQSAETLSPAKEQG
ncbi:MAG: hypothetical protein AAF810_23150, partial [Cyanobacteria bacterium P01_D01_bin.36]